MFQTTAAIQRLSAGGGMDAIEARVQQLESMLSAVEAKRVQSPDTKPPLPPLPSPSFKTFIQGVPVPPKVRPVTPEIKVRKETLRPLVERLSSQYGVDPKLVDAVICQESAYNPNAVSRCGAMGLMQLMPGTAKDLGVKNAFDPVQNLEGGIRFLGNLLKKYNGNIPLTLAAYNAGAGAVAKHGGIPPYRETQHYVRKILSAYLM